MSIPSQGLRAAGCRAGKRPRALWLIRLPSPIFSGIKSKSGRLVLCHVSTGRPWFLILASSRRKTFAIVHSLAHPSIYSSTRLVIKNFVWQSTQKDFRELVWKCKRCQAQPPINALPQPTRRFSTFTRTSLYPCRHQREKEIFNPIKDRSTHWPEATPMEHATTQSCTCTLLSLCISFISVPLSTSHQAEEQASSLTYGEGWSNSSAPSSISRQYITHKQTDSLSDGTLPSKQPSQPAALHPPVFRNSLGCFSGSAQLLRKTSTTPLPRWCTVISSSQENPPPPCSSVNAARIGSQQSCSNQHTSTPLPTTTVPRPE